MDEELFKKLFEQGLISDRPPKMWMPMNSKDGKWQNYYTGRSNIMMHLAGGWMINVDTYELTQIASSTEFDTELIKSIQSIFDQLGFEYLIVNDSSGHAIVVRGQFSILGSKIPLTIRFREFGFDPKKAMNKSFYNELYSRLPDRFEAVVNHIPEYDDDGEDLGTFGDTGIEFTTEIDQPITVYEFPKFVEQRRKEIDVVLSRLTKYRFDR